MYKERVTLPNITIERGDITTVAVDAIVNAANSNLLGGGGVDGAIHRAAGPDLVEACRQLPKKEGIRCPFGEARITAGFELPARHVIHTVGPIYARTPDPKGVLRRAYLSCLRVAGEHGLESIAFPAISTGAYGFPLGPAASIALEAMREAPPSVRSIRFILFTEAVLAAFERASRN